MVLGAVLAAGAGRRFGSPKILARQGEWLSIAVDALVGGGCDEVVVAMGAAVVPSPPGARKLIVDDWASGLSATVRAVLGHARATPGCGGVVLHVVDTPDVGGDVVRRLLLAGGRSSPALARVVYDGRPGHPVYLGRAHFDGVAAVLHGDAGAGAYLMARAAEVIAVECGDLATGLDIDTER
ncbi:MULTISPECIES: nucleotidyltransferase family protein [Gordonia]|nr:MULTISPECIES: NTP transferase domain-containing protein [Gordonia]